MDERKAYTATHLRVTVQNDLLVKTLKIHHSQPKLVVKSPRIGNIGQLLQAKLRFDLAFGKCLISVAHHSASSVFSGIMHQLNTEVSKLNTRLICKGIICRRQKKYQHAIKLDIFVPKWCKTYAFSN
jgi:hypothetical protein